MRPSTKLSIMCILIKVVHQTQSNAARHKPKDAPQLIFPPHIWGFEWFSWFNSDFTQIFDNGWYLPWQFYQRSQKMANPSRLLSFLSGRSWCLRNNSIICRCSCSHSSGFSESFPLLEDGKNIPLSWQIYQHYQKMENQSRLLSLFEGHILLPWQQCYHLQKLHPHKVLTCMQHHTHMLISILAYAPSTSDY